MEVMNSSLVPTDPLLVEKMKPESNLLKGKEVPYFFLHIFVMVVFLIICFALSSCWNKEGDSWWCQAWRWFCKCCEFTSRTHRWRALHNLHRECFQEEMGQKSAEANNNRRSRGGEKAKLLTLPDQPFATITYGAVDKMDHV